MENRSRIGALMVIGILAFNGFPISSALAGSSLAVIGEGGTAIDLKAATDIAQEEAMRLRTELGLDTDIAVVTSLARTTAPSTTIGIPLTSAEESLMQERIRIQGELQPLKDYEHAHSSIWGGTWLTYPIGSTPDHATAVNVGLTQRSDVTELEIAGLLPKGADLIIHDARYTEAELDAQHLRILADAEFYRAIGTELYSVGTSVHDNTLAIEVSTTNPTIEAAIVGHFPAGMVRVEVGTRPLPDACTRTNCGPPWRGGLKIYAGTYDICSSGFVGQRYAGVWSYVLWTGGHCKTGTWHLGSANGTTIGSTGSNYFRNGTNVDVQTISINSSQIANYYLDGPPAPGTCTLKPVVGSEPSNSDSVGNLVRANGAVTGSVVGTLVEKNRTYSMVDPYNPDVTITLTNIRRATYTRHKGDSGGPVLRAHYGYYGAYDVAAGQHTDYIVLSGTTYALYTHIAIIEAATGHTVYRTY